MDKNPRCIICDKEDSNLSEIQDVKAWKTLLNAAEIRGHQGILDLKNTNDEDALPEVQIRYHRCCRSSFTHKKALLKLSDAKSTPALVKQPEPSTFKKSQRQHSTDILPDLCIFCKKDKYLPKSTTREKIRSCMELRSDELIRRSAVLHIDRCTEMSSIAHEVLPICSKDLISSEGKYHGSCYKSFVRISYDAPASVSKPAEKDESNIDRVYKSVYKFCDDLLKNPRVVDLQLIKDLMTKESNNLNIEMPQSHYKNIVRKLSSKFENELHFIHITNKVILVYPNSLSKDELVRENYKYKAELESLNALDDNEFKDVIKVARKLNNDIISLDPQMSWPPKAQDLNVSKVSQYIPQSLDMFCTVLLSGETVDGDRSRGEMVTRLKYCLAQDMIYSVSNGKIKTPKSILFPSVVKSLCNNTEVIKLINQYGHGISYNLVEEIETEHALDILDEQKDKRVLIPEEIKREGDDSPVALMVADNIDNLENTLSGGGTSHRVNSILVKKRKRSSEAESMNEDNEDDNRPSKKKCLRSLPSESACKEIPDYYGGARVGPGVLEHVSNIHTSVNYRRHARKLRKRYLIWVEVRKLKTHPTLLVPGWTGFYISVRNNLVVVDSVVSYLDTLDSPATDLKTVHEVLCRACEIKDRLGLECVACVFDQAFYAKAMEIYWKHMDKFKDVIVMLGGFHLMMMLFGVIGCRFGDAGLQELAVQSDLIAEGSIDGVLSGKHYNRAVRLHKIVYEALMKLLIISFETSVDEEGQVLLTQLDETLEDLKLDVSQETFDEALNNDAFNRWYEMFDIYTNDLKNKGSDLAKFWYSYLELVELALNLIYATRTGDWELYLSCIEEVIPWAFAYDRQNYARYLVPYINDMRKLPPTIHNAFVNGDFSVQLGKSNPFGGIEADKAIEMTINRDCKTGGGYIGFSANASATQRWVLNASRRGQYKQILREHLSIKQRGSVHKELTPGRTEKDIQAVGKVIDVLEDVFINPWTETDFTSLSSGVEATGKVRDDLLNAQSIGQDACKEFVQNRCLSNPKLNFFDPLKKKSLKTFKDMKKVSKVKCKDLVVPLKLDRNLFARMALLSQFRKIDLKFVFTFPLGPLPWSLSNAYGMPRKTNKAQLLHLLEKDVPIAERHPDACSIFDGMALLQKFKPPAGATFGILAERILDAILNSSEQRIDVVFDVYKDVSIKNTERSRRSQELPKGTRYKNLQPGFPIKSWRNFLTLSCNKVEIVKFLVTFWKRPECRGKLGERVLYVTQEEECWKLTSSSFEMVPELRCSHEEADTRIILHAVHCQCPFIVHADDTDVLVLLLAHSTYLNRIGYMKMGKGQKTRIVQLHLIREKLLKDLESNPEITENSFLKSLIGLHAFTGCDSVSSFAGKGKTKAFKLLKGSSRYVNAFMALGDSWIIDDGLFDVLEEFVCDLYGKKTSSSVNLLRYQLHCAKGGSVEPELLPPCRSSLELHIRRANYQAGIWRRAITALPDNPSPRGQGWEVTDDGSINIKWLSSKPAPEEVLEMLACVCKKSCTIASCCCLKAGLKCTDMCSLECDNMAVADEMDNTFDIDEDGEDDF